MVHEWHKERQVYARKEQGKGGWQNVINRISSAFCVRYTRQGDSYLRLEERNVVRIMPI